MPRHVQPEDASVEVTLANWRNKAANTLWIASTIVYLPVVVIFVAGWGPPVTWLVKMIVLAVYGIHLLATLLWRTDYRARIWVNLVTAYVLAVVGAIAAPQGPFIRALPITIPFTAMAFFDKRVGRAATGISILILLFAPPMSTVPGLVGILTTEEVRTSISPQLIWFQGVAMTALLVGVVILLNSFHDILIRSLTDRTSAYQRLQDEMEERQRLENEAARAADEERRRRNSYLRGR